MRLLLSFVLLGGMSIAQDWTPIQPDASFTGWTRVPLQPTVKLDGISQWRIARDGDVICDGSAEKGHEFLRYDRELANFVAHVEWKFADIGPDAKYNSGVFVRTSSDGLEWYQAQVGPPSNSGFFFYDAPSGGARKRVSLKSEMAAHPVKPAGEWNSYEIRADGPRVTLSVNGIETSHFDCERPKGYFGLEAEHYRIEFRNIKVKVLP